MSSTVQDAPIIPRDGVIRIRDLTELLTPGTGLFVEAWYEDGTFNADGLMEEQMSVQAFKSRGRTYAVRKVEDQEVTGGWDCHLVALTGGSRGTPADAFRKRGAWRNAISTGRGRGDGHLVCVEWLARTTELDASQDAYLRLRYCHGIVGIAEGVPGKLSIKFTNYNLDTDAVSDGAATS